MRVRYLKDLDMDMEYLSVKISTSILDYLLKINLRGKGRLVGKMGMCILESFKMENSMVVGFKYFQGKRRLENGRMGPLKSG